MTGMEELRREGDGWLPPLLLLRLLFLLFPLLQHANSLRCLMFHSLMSHVVVVITMLHHPSRRMVLRLCKLLYCVLVTRVDVFSGCFAFPLVLVELLTVVVVAV